MKKIRVLVVDDSVVVRRLVTEALAGEPRIEVVGTAANGRLALAKIAQLLPDVVTLDVEMPELDGLATLAEERRSWPKLPVIMFSSITARGAAATLDALALGANDYVTKVTARGIDDAVERVRAELAPKILLFGGDRRSGDTSITTSPVRHPRTVDVLAIGCSTGGPNALHEIIGGLRAPLPVPVVIVQHMPPVFTRLLAERLHARGTMTVREGSDGARLTPGEVLIAPGDHHMRVVRDGTHLRVALDQGPPENSCRPAVDVLFRSLAALDGVSVLAVVLTGMGRDGLRGCELLREASGDVLAQDEATSVVWGMPGFVARAGLASAVLPLPSIGAEIERRVRWRTT